MGPGPAGKNFKNNGEWERGRGRRGGEKHAMLLEAFNHYFSLSSPNCNVSSIEYEYDASSTLYMMVET